MRHSLLCLAFFFGLFHMAHGGATHYVRVAGSDAADGHSWATAWATTAKVQSTIVVGDTVLFGAGVYWNTRISPPAGGDNSTWTVYADSTFKTDPMASKGLATLSGGSVVTGWVDTTIGGVAADKSTSFTPYSCIRTTPMCAVQPFAGTDSQLVYETALGNVTRNGEYYFANGTVYVNAYNDKNLGTNDTIIVACGSPIRISNTNVSCVRVFGLQLLHGDRAPVIISGSDVDSVVVEHCHIAYAGITNDENPCALHSTDIGVSSSRYGNTLRSDSLGWFLEVASSSATPPLSGCTFGGAVDVYSQDHLMIESCYVYDVVFDGFFFKYAILNSTVRFNTINGVRGTGALATYNTCIRDSFYGNIVTNSNAGIRADNLATTPTDSNFWFNNSFYNVNHFISSQDRATPTGRSIIKYNAFYDQTYGDNIWISMATPTTSIWHMDSNYYYDNPVSTFNAQHGWCSGSSWSAWTTTCGMDQNGSGVVDPNFNNPSAGDFSRPSASGEMSRSYGGRDWTIFGAVQEVDSCPSVNRDSVPNSATTRDITPNYVFDISDGTNDTVYYEVLRDTYNPPTTVRFSGTVATPANNITHTESGLADRTTYFWRIAYTDTVDISDGNCTETTSVYSYFVDTVKCPVAASVTPANGATVTQDTLRPTASFQTDDYSNIIVRFYGETGDATPDFLLFTDTLTTDSTNWNAFKWTGLVNGLTYYWQVVAQDPDCSHSSDIRSFNVVITAGTIPSMELEGTEIEGITIGKANENKNRSRTREVGWGASGMAAGAAAGCRAYTGPACLAVCANAR